MEISGCGRVPTRTWNAPNADHNRSNSIAMIEKMIRFSANSIAPLGRGELRQGIRQQNSGFRKVIAFVALQRWPPPYPAVYIHVLRPSQSVFFHKSRSAEGLRIGSGVSRDTHGEFVSSMSTCTNYNASMNRCTRLLKFNMSMPTICSKSSMRFDFS